MRKLLYLFVASALGLALSSCSSTKIYSDVDPSVDFTKYKTFEYYGWAKESDKLLNDLDKDRIEKAFGEEFAKRGLKYVKEGGDLIVTLFIVTENKTATTATTTHMGMGYGGYYGYGPAYGWGPSMSTAHTTFNEYEYTVGTLVVDVYDAKNKKLIWEGVAQGTIDENPRGREENIKKVAAQIMARYPVQPPKDK